MHDLVPLKVKIPLNAQGQHAYPKFNLLPEDVRGGMDWSKFIDTHGTGWHYDKVSGHGYSDQNNSNVPPNHPHKNDDPTIWYGCVCVPEPFADAAAAMFPELVEIIDEASFESFYDDRAHVHEEAELLDRDVVDMILTQRKAEAEGLLPPPSAETLQRRADAMDPSKPNRGLRKNMNRRYADMKAARGLTIKNKPKNPRL